MKNKVVVPQPRSFVSSIKRYLSSPGIIWWGLPGAVVLAVWTTWMAHGYAWRNLLTVEFLIRLVVSVVIFGVIGGRSFARGMRRLGAPIEHHRSKHHDQAG
jgi:hypothetical protein